jgi:hypothetical protein
LGHERFSKPQDGASRLGKNRDFGWMNALRPSTRPLRGRLRMRNFLNAIDNIPHAESL